MNHYMWVIFSTGLRMVTASTWPTALRLFFSRRYSVKRKRWFKIMTKDIVHDVDDVVVKAEMISLIGLKKRNIINAERRRKAFGKETN